MLWRTINAFPKNAHYWGTETVRSTWLNWCSEELEQLEVLLHYAPPSHWERRAWETLCFWGNIHHHLSLLEPCIFPVTCSEFVNNHLFLKEIRIFSWYSWKYSSAETEICAAWDLTWFLLKTRPWLEQGREGVPHALSCSDSLVSIHKDFLTGKRKERTLPTSPTILSSVCL